VKLSILIVNWNSRDFLRKCLRSIEATCGDLDTQVIVVDGGSFDGCAEMIGVEFPWVDFVQSADNLGFGGSNNLGATRATGDALLILNPDTEIRPGAVQRLLSEFKRVPQAGILSPRLLNSDASLQCSVHALPRPVRQALDSEFLRRVLLPLSCWAPPSEFAPPATVAVEAVAGTCMLMPTEVFRAVGGFSPEYFMYAEDVDLCEKVLRAGLKIYHVPDAEVLHHGGCSSMVQSSKFSAVMIRDALHTYLLLNRGRHAALTYRVFSAGVAMTRIVWAIPKLLVARADRRAGIRAAISRSAAVVSWSAGFERWTKDVGPKPASNTGASARQPAF
jgi:GT2 family glycosyltransferase